MCCPSAPRASVCFSVSCVAYLQLRQSRVPSSLFRLALPLVTRGGPQSAFRVPPCSRLVACGNRGARGVARYLGCGTPIGHEASASLCPNKRPSLIAYDFRCRFETSSRKGRRASSGTGVDKECYLVDPASSHMLVSKIKPCMCKYELIQTVKLRMAH